MGEEKKGRWKGGEVDRRRNEEKDGELYTRREKELQQLQKKY